jgi:hypothetical protein
MPQDAANVRVWLDVDDATANVPASALSQGSGARYLHVTAGQGYPLAERIQALP